MTSAGDDIAVATHGTKSSGTSTVRWNLRDAGNRLSEDPRYLSLVATVATTFVVFAIYLIQGIIVARLLGPAGRGEFGTCLYFPRDIFLYAGLLGSIDIINSYAAARTGNQIGLKVSAVRLGWFTGLLTACFAAAAAIVLLIATDRQYLIPFALVCCLFVPFEHIQLTVSAVDRGKESFGRFNVNRLVFASSFPLMLLAAWAIDLSAWLGISWLWIACGTWVISRIVGLLPTLRGIPVSRLFSAPFTDQDLTDGVPAPRQLLREGRPYAVSMFVSEVFERLDIFLVLALASMTEAGFYFVAVPAAAMLTIAPNALSVFTFNAGASSPKPVSRGLAMRVMLATAMFQAISAGLYALVIDDLILFCFTDRFAASIPLVLLLLPASAIRGFLQAADGYLRGRGKPMIGVWARTVSIFLMLIFVSLAWGPWGLPSIPVAACLGQAFSMVVIVAAIWLDCGPDRRSGQMEGV